MLRQLGSLAGRLFLFGVTSLSSLAVLFIFIYVIKDALPFFRQRGFGEFFTSTNWYPSGKPGEFGMLAIFIGSGLVTLGAVVISMLLGVTAAVCLSDVLLFSVRQLVKPIIEILTGIPLVAYGFFALVVFAPMLQNQGGRLLACAEWVVGIPTGVLAVILLTEILLQFSPTGHAHWAG